MNLLLLVALVPSLLTEPHPGNNKLKGANHATPADPQALLDATTQFYGVGSVEETRLMDALNSGHVNFLFLFPEE